VSYNDGMTFLILFFVFAFGAIIGSFLNVVLLRKNTGESIVHGGSRCFSCGQSLGSWEMIPILSFLWQKGKCKNCGSKISWQYIIVESALGFLALAVFCSLYSIRPAFYGGLTAYGWMLWFFYFAAFAILFLIAVYDFKRQIIDRHFIYAFLPFAILEFIKRGNFADDLASSFLIALFFYLLWLVSSGRWMGRGDTDLAFVAALFLGFPANVFMLFLSFWIGAFVGIYLLFFKKDKFALSTEIPFGPFMVLALFVAWYFGEFALSFMPFVL